MINSDLPYHSGIIISEIKENRLKEFSKIMNKEILRKKGTLCLIFEANFRLNSKLLKSLWSFGHKTLTFVKLVNLTWDNKQLSKFLHAYSHVCTIDLSFNKILDESTFPTNKNTKFSIESLNMFSTQFEIGHFKMIYQSLASNKSFIMSLKSLNLLYTGLQTAEVNDVLNSFSYRSVLYI